MRVRKVIRRLIRTSDGGVDLAGDVDVVIAANVGEGGGRASATSGRRSARRSPRSSPEGRDPGDPGAP